MIPPRLLPNAVGRSRLCPGILLATLGVLLAATIGVGEENDAPSVRQVRFTYGGTVVGLTEGDDVRVWLPTPPSNAYQTVRNLDKVLPADGQLNTEKKFGNQILYFEMQANASGMFGFSTAYEVTRREVRGKSGEAGDTLSTAEQDLFLAPNEKVPVDGKPIELLKGLELASEPLSVGRQLYELVDQHMKYDKSIPGFGKGDVLWACDSRTGNCTDFHSLFISLARNQKIPARFEIGFPLPEERGSGAIAGYHCWAMFHVDKRGWFPVDISEADKHPELSDYYFGNLTENRIQFTTGRDLTLVPPQSGPALNYFVYPYVEVNGKPYTQQNIKLRLNYQDLSE